MSVTVDSTSGGLLTPAMLCGVALVGLVVQFALPSTIPSAVADARAPRIASASIPTLAPLPDYPAIGLRPLFSPGRGAAGAGASAAAAGAFALLGVASTLGRASAVLRASDGLHTLRRGETLEGWRLVAIGADRATLERGGRLQALRVGTASTAPR